MWLSGNAVITALVREKQRNTPQSAEMEGVHLGANTNTNTDPQTKSERILDTRYSAWRLSLRQREFHSNTERERERVHLPPYSQVHRSHAELRCDEVNDADDDDDDDDSDDDDGA